MASKILQAHTIIPDNLYVYREADRQLEDIIKEMGRPGYVLVARQMGKTNLLLNAKRRLPNSGDVFVYADMSNSFSDARECFRHIVDIAIETHPEQLNFIYEDIENDRKTSKYPAHIEHIHELRKIIKIIKGKLVIILDEIDALSNTHFSDSIFKQIRSSYFSRVNYPEFYRLTYLLSGVAEPSTLIKDPKISPFNIGQNIFLGDFDKGEMEEFLLRSQLVIENKIVDRLFYWTGGNPRMTYDVCSLIEDEVNNNKIITADIIDRIVNQLYLKSFDIAPIDNIRDLVKNDGEIRNAIRLIKNGKSTDIKSHVRKKLYLAGIVGSEFESEAIKIKNNIIDRALSSEWLKEIDQNEGALLQKVGEYISTKRYNDALNLLEGIIDDIDYDVFYFYQASIITTYFNLKKFDSIIEHFNKRGIDSTDDKFIDLKTESLYLLGLAYLYTGDGESAVEVFKVIVDLNKKDTVYFKSLCNIPSFLNEGDNNSQEIINNSIYWYSRVIKELTEYQPKLTSGDIEQFRSISYFNIGKYYLALSNISDAKANFEKSLKVSSTSLQPRILYQLSALEDSIERKAELLSTAIDSIIGNQLKPYDYGVENTLSVGYDLILMILNDSKELDLQDLITELLQYALSVETSRISNGASIIDNQPTANIEDELAVLKFILDGPNYGVGLTHKQLLHIYNSFRIRALFNNHIAIENGMPFINLLISGQIKTDLDLNDTFMLISFMDHYASKGDTKLVQKVISFLKNIGFAKKDTKAGQLLINYFEMQTIDKSVDQEKLFEKSVNILKIFSEFNADEPSPLINKSSLDAIKGQAVRHYSKLIPFFLKNIKRKYPERNEKVSVIYSNGDVLTDKYKKLQTDVLAGKCRIL